MARLLYKLRKFNYVPHATTARRMRCHPQPDYETVPITFYRGDAVCVSRTKIDFALDTFTSFSPLPIQQIGKPAFLC